MVTRSSPSSCASCTASSAATYPIAFLRSGKAAIKFEIVTQQPDEISQELIHRLGHSATRVEGKGMYSGAATSILLCVINKGQLVEFENIIHRYPGTFAYLSQVKEVAGNFKHINKNGQQEEPSA